MLIYDFDLSQERYMNIFSSGNLISENILNEFVDCARISPSLQNKQPKKYVIVKSKEACSCLFSMCGNLKNINIKPSAYIIVLHDKTISNRCDIDTGIVCCSIALNAQTYGINTIILTDFDKSKLRDYLLISESNYNIDAVLALGHGL